jgi:pimeloyl-ACP methyl ester carboxylesterase
MKKSLVLLLFIALCSGSFAQRIISKTLLRSYTKRQLDSVLTANGVPAIFSTTYDVDVYKLIYHTVSYDSTPTYASGLMAVPKSNSCKSFPMASYMHGTTSDKEGVPSRLGGQEPVVGMIMASIGYVMCEPDYLGLGDGPGLHPYQHAQTEASASIDMLRSVREFCDSTGIRRNGQLFLMGYSQGGHACMATHRAIQNELHGEFNVTAAVPMSGAYDMSGVMVQTMLSNAPYDQPGYLAYLVISWNPIYHIYDSIQQALVHPYDSILPPLLDGTHGIPTLNNAMPSVPKLIFTSSELDTFINNLNSPFRVALRANDVYGWKPNCPTRLYFCRADSYVPFMNSVVCYDSMRAHGVTTVDTADINPNLGHVDCAQFAILSAKSFFDQFMTIDQFTITSQPSPQVVQAGGTVVYGVGASDPQATYQWQVDLGMGFQDISGATADTLVIGQIAASESGQRYRCVVTGPGGCTVNSNAAALTVLTGIADIDAANSISVYPNPAKDHVTITSNADQDMAASLYDMNGQKVLDASLHNGKNALNINSISAGVYVLKAFDANNNYKQVKVVVE